MIISIEQIGNAQLEKNIRVYQELTMTRLFALNTFLLSSPVPVRCQTMINI